MLNYIWISLVVIGILVAAGTDLNNEMKNTYRNGAPFIVKFEPKTPEPIDSRWEGTLILRPHDINNFYGIDSQQEESRQPISLVMTSLNEGTLKLRIEESSPRIWKEMAKSASTKDYLTGHIIGRGVIFEDNVGQGSDFEALNIVFEPIRFVKLKAVTQAAIDYAKIAVDIALGLIGIMALWLGVMKVAEAAGLIKVLTTLLRPLSKRLFPDVPPDHPAIGSIIMNISANMLGLSNAATPFGLKAMEELNKLNPKLGTATNAMCTFLVINTSGLVLIPATAIAVRAAAGSANPGIIIGTSIFGAGLATLAGLVAVKILEKLPRYKKELLPDAVSETKEGGNG